MTDAPTLQNLRTGGKRSLARALAQVERAPRALETVALLDAAFAQPRGLTVGVTGPPGVGKSSLLDTMIARLRAEGKTVAVIAVDPSSARTGGALLGDRARFASLDPLDPGVFVRSMATRGRLGGLSDLAFPAMMLMQATHDVVLVETVGVGQSEIEISGIADITILCVQPASGDSLQFLKSGVMEVPDMILVTKSDLGSPARRAAADLRSALSVTQGQDDATAIHLVSAHTGEGVAETLATLLSFRFSDRVLATGIEERRKQAARWHSDNLLINFGTFGLAKIQEVWQMPLTNDVFARYAKSFEDYANALEGLDL